MSDRRKSPGPSGLREIRRGTATVPTRPRSFPAPETARIAPPPSVRSAPPPSDRTSILERYAAAPTVVITHERVVEGDEAELLHAAYRANFDPLAELAIQAQASDREEMLAEFANPNITKIVAREQGIPVGLGMVTNHLESVPDINAEFLRSRYPDHAARDAIYIGMYVMVAPGHRGLTLFQRLYLEMWQVPAREGGLMIFDVCEFNRTTFDTDVLAERIASNFPRSSVDVLDRQTWYVAELPEPIPDARR